MALAKLTRLRVLRLFFAVVALFFVVSNVRSLAHPVMAGPSLGNFAPKGAWGPAARAAERAAQRAWARGIPSRPLAMARSLVAVVNRSFFDAESPSASADLAFDEDGDEGQPEGGAALDLFDAPLPNRPLDLPSPPPLLAPWGRRKAPVTPLEPFCPPIQRPPIGVLGPRHATWQGLITRN